MLVELHIRDFALIDELTIEFVDGFSVLTGETGAGKSIIVDSLGAALGERMSVDMIRTGAQKCIVEAVFDISNSPAAGNAAAQHGFDAEDDVIILSREISRSGRSQARINGRPATTSTLKEISSRLVDVHGQHEHQSLLQVPIHIDILDASIGERAYSLRQQASDLFCELQALIKERNTLKADERDRARLVDLYTFQQTEIQSAGLVDGETGSLSDERNRLANAERLCASAAELHDALAGSETSVIDRLSEATGIANRIAELDPSMESLTETLNAALINAQDSAVTIRDYIEQVEANPERLEQVEERLELINGLKRKYGDEIADILRYAEEVAEKLDKLTNSEERSSELAGRITDLEARLRVVCEDLTKIRKAASKDFEKKIESELKELAMEKTRFEVSIQPGEPGPNGADAIEFLISPNPGEPVKALAKIASGGEMSRIMLALKTVVSRPEVPTLIFDEIDSGIGGRTAQILGDKLASLAGRCQIICVTHLPQVAGKARSHFSISKSVRDNRTLVQLKALTQEDRIAELARMLGAADTSGAAVQHAKEILSLASSGNN
ncbi:MAG: DNA repair protein RecN [Armatimonadetes bacterium]|nr:DNA repair protein RecN [Armatimonadota bacterium]